MLAKTVRDIRSLKIQGAEAIAVAAVRAVQHLCRNTRAEQFSDRLAAAHAALISARPTEPFLRNCLNAIVHGNYLTVEEVQRRIRLVLQHIETADVHILRYAAPLIKSHAHIYTHCHSSTVTHILKDAQQHGKKIVVHNTETRPRFQGRITAAELAKANIPVVHYVDAAMRIALQHAELMLIGADAITTQGAVVNKIGSLLAAETAQSLGIPVYICTNSWKYDPATVHVDEPIEERAAKEVWDRAPKKVVIHNPAFDRIDPKLITAIISELGIHTPEKFVRTVREKYPVLDS